MSCYFIHYSKRPGCYTRPHLVFQKSYLQEQPFSTLETLLNFVTLSVSDAEKFVQVFMTSRLGYCYALLAGFPASSNKQAAVLTRSRKYDHITSILSSLHRLPVKFQLQSTTTDL